MPLSLTLASNRSSHAYYKQNEQTELEPMRSSTAATLLGPTNIQMPHGVDAGEPRVIVYRGTSTLYRPVGRG